MGTEQAPEHSWTLSWAERRSKQSPWKLCRRRRAMFLQTLNPEPVRCSRNIKYTLLIAPSTSPLSPSSPNSNRISANTPIVQFRCVDGMESGSGHWSGYRHTEVAKNKDTKRWHFHLSVYCGQKKKSVSPKKSLFLSYHIKLYHRSLEALQ